MMWTMRGMMAGLIGALVLIAGCGAAPPSPASAPSPAFVALVGAVSDRLATADTVAASKWGTRGAVEDPSREQVVLDAAAAGAPARGLDPALVAAVFRDQIQASKVVQYGLLEDWTADSAAAPTAAPDLASIRPVLDGVTPRLLDALVATRGDGSCTAQRAAAEEQAVASRGWDALHRRGLDRALRSVCG
jgi:chorismate mutase